MLNIELLLVSKHGESLLMCPAVLGAHIVYTLIKLFVVRMYIIAVHSD